MDYSQQFLDLLKQYDIRIALSKKDFKSLYDGMGDSLTREFTDFCLKVLKIDPLEYMDYIPERFLYRSNIKEVTIPNTIRSIGDSAFHWCKSLTNIKLPNSITTIGDAAFSGCNLLKDINIPDNVTRIGSHLFYGCEALTNIVIPDGVTEIGVDAFYYCECLEDVQLPGSLISVGTGAFYSCINVTKVNYTGTVDDWVMIQFESPFANPIQYANSLYINNQLLTDAVLTNKVTKIGDYAFIGCTSLESIIIPDTVTEIGVSAFSGCDSLRRFTFTGTMEQWESITKKQSWLSGVPQDTYVQCKDGKIYL